MMKSPTQSSSSTAYFKYLGKPNIGPIYFILLTCGALSCGPAPPQLRGNLEIAAGKRLDFSYSFVADQIAFNEGDLMIVPQDDLRNAHVTVSYSDKRTNSTLAGQKEVVLFARDPDEYETTLESIKPSLSSAFDSGEFRRNATTPDDYSKQGDANAASGVTLPDAFAIPYPQSNAGTKNPSMVPPTLTAGTPVTQGDFLGALSPNRASFSGPSSIPAGGSVKGAYIFQHGVCSSEENIKDLVLSQVTKKLPDGIRQGALSYDDFVGSGLNQLQLDLATFVNKPDQNTIVGGFVQQFVFQVEWSNIIGDLLNPAWVATNYTFQFTLENGILSAAPTRNLELDTGAFSQTLAARTYDGDGGLALHEARGIKLGALEKQSNPLSRPKCEGAPADCYFFCELSESPLPPLDAGSTGATDDSAWYDSKYCGTAADTLAIGVALGEDLAGITDPGTNKQISDSLVGLRPGSDKFANIRCNFHPTYATRPVCEVVARAKRINIFPDNLELVWFDGPFLPDATTSTFGQPFLPSTDTDGYGLYLALLGQNRASELCSRASNSRDKKRAFAFATASN